MNIINNYIKRKIMVYSISLLLILLFYLVPTKTNQVLESKSIYLLDKDDYISKVITYFDSNSIEEEIKRKIDILINGNEDTILFNTTIPKNTKVNSIKVDKNNVYIDFSNELLNINDFLKEKMIESIVYSLSDINGINNVYITINNKEIYNKPLTRNIGINKEYNLCSLDNINRITVYYYNDKHIVPVTKIINDNTEKIEIIIKELKNNINNLNGLMEREVKLLNYKIDNDSIRLVFNCFSFDIDLLKESIFENYNVSKIIIEDKNGNVKYDINR